MDPIRVFILDEHKVSRALARRVIKSSPGIILVGEATSPFTVRKAVNDSQPDVLALNSLSRISKHFDNLSNTLDVPVIQIPQPGLDYNWHSIELHKVQYAKYSSELINEIKAVVKGSVGKAVKRKTTKPRSVKTKIRPGKPAAYSSTCEKMSKFEQSETVDTSQLKSAGGGLLKTRLAAAVDHPLVVIGAPGGDLDAMRVVLSGLQSQLTGILIAQQIPTSFDQQYMDALNEISILPVTKAMDGQHIKPGKILLSPSDTHIEVVKKNGRYCCHFPDIDQRIDTARKPSLDLLFSSLAKNAGSMGIGILLLGVGSEGTKGLSRLKRAGANILVQENDLHANPSLNGSMPSAAIMNGGAELIVPLTGIATKVTQIISESLRDD